MKSSDRKFGKITIGAIAVIIMTILLALSVSVLGFRGGQRAEAEGNRTITLHVYDTATEYDKLGGWFWLKGGDGVEVKISASPASDEGFQKSYELNGQTVVNKAHTFTVTYTQAELAKTPEVGFLVCASKGGSGADFWDRYAKETADIFIDTSALFASGDSADVYYIRKDTVVYTNLEDAKMALEKVISARFMSQTAIEFEATSPITKDTKVVLYDGEKKIKEFTAKPDASNSFKGTISLSGVAFDYSADYRITVANIPTPMSVSKAALLDEAGFIKAYETVDTQEKVTYGATYSPEKTDFALWAPFASEVDVKIYDNGTDGESYTGTSMKKRLVDGKWGGVWEASIAGDLKDRYYTYSINNSGVPVETIDPYAKACGVNGARGMIVDLDSTDPDGWAEDKRLAEGKYSKNADVPIIWELHVKDFSASADSGMVNKGKYLAFTETGTKVPGTDLQTGVDYLETLGITYVHLNPVYDFSSIYEDEVADIDNRDKFNWGYDPQNYNIPDGSYSSNPYDGNVRINEFKQMVMALHNKGIGVIMDVVYNHTYSTSNLALGDAVPGYYYRTNKNGEFTNGSGCGNEIASERSMVRKYIIDSVLYWAQEYHIDGFRFDLMGVHDVKTMNMLREELNKLDGGKGKKILTYGEPWTGDGVESGSKYDQGALAGTYIKYSYHTRVNATSSAIAGTGKYTSNSGNKLVYDSYQSGTLADLDARVAIFNGPGRDGIRGSSWDIDARQNGWIQGDPEGKGGDVLSMIRGDTKGMSRPSQNVAYASVHDNFTLWDHIIGKSSGTETPLFYDAPMDHQKHMVETVSAAYLMSRGMSLMIAGEEMARTKFGNHNSYNSPIKLNQIDWSRQAIFSDVYNHYKKVIAVRKAYSDIFSYEKAANGTAPTASVSASGLVITVSYSSGGKTLKAVFNAGDSATSVNTSGMRVYVANGQVTSSFSGSLGAKCCVVMGSETVA